MCFHSINVPSEWGPLEMVDVYADYCYQGLMPKGLIGFHSINVPSEWGPLNFKPLPSKVSRDSFQRSGKKVVKPLTERGKKPLKPLPSKRPKFSTKKSTLQPFYLIFGKTTQ